MGMDMSHAVAAPGTAAALFHCTPLSGEERLDAYGPVDRYSQRISTSSWKAQRLFDQGMMLAWNYNQEEALVSFKEGLKYDPASPRLHWGIAYASGAYLNKAAAAPPK
ncbi:MAG: hypothetical protein WDW36_004526 [Sanguina aurantia]